MSEKVESWDDIVENLSQYKRILENRQNITYDRFTQFSLWYYFPNENFFAPNKFLINKNTTLENYDGKDFSANREEPILLKYFNEVSKESNIFEELYSKLVEFSNDLGKELNIAVKNGNGGIFIPKDKYTYNSFDDLTESEHKEGKAKEVFINIYERDPRAREKCLDYYGNNCIVCGLLLSDIYGDIADGFIHVHHIKELSSIKKEYIVDPINDLRPLCPNCHSIIHRKRPELTIEELKNIMNKYNCNRPS